MEDTFARLEMLLFKCCTAWWVLAMLRICSAWLSEGFAVDLVKYNPFPLNPVTQSQHRVSEALAVAGSDGAWCHPSSTPSSDGVGCHIKAHRSL